MTTKDVMEGVRALGEMMELFKDSKAKVVELLPPFVRAAEGDPLAWFQGMEKVADLDVDDAQGALIVALSTIGRIKVAMKDTPCEETLREIFKPKES